MIIVKAFNIILLTEQLVGNMGSRHDFIEYAFAREVTTKFPQIIKDMEALRDKLRPNVEFATVAHTVQTLNESLELAETQLLYYSTVLKNKGR